MFRRRMDSGIVYDILINKEMCPDAVDIYVDDVLVRAGARDHDIRISVGAPARTIQISGHVVYKESVMDDTYRLIGADKVIDGTVNLGFNSGVACVLANVAHYGRIVRHFNPETIVHPGDLRMVFFTYQETSEIIDRIAQPLQWIGSYIEGNCVRTDIGRGAISAHASSNLGTHHVIINIT